MQLQTRAGLAKIKTRRNLFREISLRKIEVDHERRFPSVSLPEDLEKTRFRPFREIAHRAAQPHIRTVKNKLPRGARAVRLYSSASGRSPAKEQGSEKDE